MRRRAQTLALTALLPVALLGGWTGSSAASSLSFISCAGAAHFECTTLAVPIDRTEAVPGTISLSIERRLAGATPSRDAVVALAGGPGQAALPLCGIHRAGDRARARLTRPARVRPARHRRIQPTAAAPPSKPSASRRPARLFEQCASQLGPVRGAFTSEESVEDIEALRKAGGYEKLVLYGTSYGTKVALDYAERYPQNVEALVLDSVVPPEGEEPFAIPTFQAIAGMLDELCSDSACAGIASNPLGDIASLAARLSRRPLSGSVYDGSGKRHASTLDGQGLLDILEAGDLNPALRALLPAAVRSALQGYPDPLLRLHLLSEGLIPNVPIESNTGEEGSQEIDEALFVTTSCEEQPVPVAAHRVTDGQARRSPQLPARPARRRLLPFQRRHRVRQQPRTRLLRVAGRIAAAACREPPAERAHADPLR